MAEKHFAIKNNKIIANIDVAPFSPRKMDKFCAEQGWDGWFTLDADGALKLMGLDK